MSTEKAFRSGTAREEIQSRHRHGMSLQRLHRATDREVRQNGNGRGKETLAEKSSAKPNKEEVMREKQDWLQEYSASSFREILKDVRRMSKLDEQQAVAANSHAKPKRRRAETKAITASAAAYLRHRKDGPWRSTLL